jgi:hypothetical protein
VANEESQKKVRHSRREGTTCTPLVLAAMHDRDADRHTMVVQHNMTGNDHMQQTMTPDSFRHGKAHNTHGSDTATDLGWRHALLSRILVQDVPNGLFD